MPWLIAGLVLAAEGIDAYALARRGTDYGGGRQPLRLDAEGASTVPDRG